MLAKTGMTIILTSFILAVCTGCGRSDKVNTVSEPEEVETGEEKITSVMDFTPDPDSHEKSTYSANISVHDPSVIKCNDTYYIVGSHMTMAHSDNLRTWAYDGNGYSSTNKVFGDLFADENNEVFYFTGKKDSVVPTDDKRCHLWAPDIIYNEKNGCYYMYYCTSSTWNASSLEFATSTDINGRYTYGGTILSSGFTRYTFDKTNVSEYADESYIKKNYLKPDGTYNFNLWPNALDPAVFYDKDGRMWMVYGSWSGGIFILEIDEETGMAIHPEADPENDVDAYFGKKLMGGGHKSIEGPYIIYDPDSDYYYLFVSYGELTAEGGYQIRVFRSRKPDGEYEDMNGQRPLYKDNDHSPFGLKLSGNYDLPSLSAAYRATGHNSAMIDTDGRKYIVCHTRFEGQGEAHEPRVKQYFLNKEGWPVMLPYITDSEQISKTGYRTDEISGRYYFIDQGTGIGPDIAEPSIMYLDDAGTTYKKSSEGLEITGSYTVEEGSPYVTFEYEGVKYSGVFCKQKDEAGKEVMVFTAAGANACIWGVKYL